MTHLYLIRHGETDWNLEGRWQGQADVTLNERGRQQAQQIAEKLADIPLEAVYSSDLIRAIEVARRIAGRQGVLAPVILDRRLREIHQGEWQGLLVEEIQARFADAFQQRRIDPYMMAAPGGETAQEVRERALAAISDLVAAYPVGNVAVVSHGFTLAVLLTHFQRRAFEKVWELVPENGAVIELEVASAQASLK